MKRVVEEKELGKYIFLPRILMNYMKPDLCILVTLSKKTNDFQDI